jgi:hypothetical protein
MSSIAEIGISTATKLPEGGAVPIQRKNGHTNGVTATKPTPSTNKSAHAYNHVFAIHREAKVSPFDHDAPELSFFGFKNLMALMLSTCIFSGW